MKTLFGTLAALLTAIFICIPVLPATAQKSDGLPSGFPKGRPAAGVTQETAALTVRGKIGNSETILLDIATLKALPAVTFSSIDPWDGKVHSFTGVQLKDLLVWLGIEPSATSVSLNAKNLYSIAIRRDDYEKYGYIIAYLMDGKEFSADPATKKRGPLSIAIDFTKNKDLPQDIYKHQLLWQLVEIIVQ
jgi:hypothetical protein